MVGDCHKQLGTSCILRPPLVPTSWHVAAAIPLMRYKMRHVASLGMRILGTGFQYICLAFDNPRDLPQPEVLQISINMVILAIALAAYAAFTPHSTIQAVSWPGRQCKRTKTQEFIDTYINITTGDGVWAESRVTSKCLGPTLYVTLVFQLPPSNDCNWRRLHIEVDPHLCSTKG